MGFKMQGYEARIIKVHCKPSLKSCSGKTNVRIIFLSKPKSERSTQLNIIVVGTY